MPGMTNYSATAYLNWAAGRAAMPAQTDGYLALFTAVGSDDGTGFTEVSGAGYARVHIPNASFAAPSGSAPTSIATNAQVQFPTSTGDWTNAGANPIIAWGLYDAATGGNLIAWDFLGGFNWLPFTGSAASPSVLTAPAHGYANGDKAVVTAEFGGTLPATAGSWSGLLTVANVTTDTLTLGVNSTGTGNGFVRKVATQLVPNNVTVDFQAGQITLKAA